MHGSAFYWDVQRLCVGVDNIRNAHLFVVFPESDDILVLFQHLNLLWLLINALPVFGLGIQQVLPGAYVQAAASWVFLMLVTAVLYSSRIKSLIQTKC